MNQDNPTDPSLADASHVNAADGGAAVDSSTLSLTELNQFLGKDFKDKDTALKALKDTQSFVGKRVEDIAAQVRAEAAPLPASQQPNALESEVRSLKEQVFYAQHPQYKGYESLIAKMGGNPAEVVESSEFKNVFEKVQVADEVAKTKSVVASNARVGEAQTVVTEAIKLANTRASNEDVAIALARGIQNEMASGT